MGVEKPANRKKFLRVWCVTTEFRQRMPYVASSQNENLLTVAYPIRSIAYCNFSARGFPRTDHKYTDKTPLCIHRALLGTHERFIGFLIEHYAGNFPLWLAPDQVRVMTIGEEEPLVNYAKAIVNKLRANFVRSESDFSSNKINGKIQEAWQAKVHTMLVIGGRELEVGAVSVRLHHGGPHGAKLEDERRRGFRRRSANVERESNYFIRRK
jgi:hypothetical protein